MMFPKSVDNCAKSLKVEIRHGVDYLDVQVSDELLFSGQHMNGPDLIKLLKAIKGYTKVCDIPVD